VIFVSLLLCEKSTTLKDIFCVAGRCQLPLRYTVAVLGFVGFFCAYVTRGCINVAIVAMVNSTDDGNGQLLNGSSLDRCPPQDGQNSTIRPSLQVCC